MHNCFNLYTVRTQSQLVVVVVGNFITVHSDQVSIYEICINELTQIPHNLMNMHAQITCRCCCFCVLADVVVVFVNHCNHKLQFRILVK
jgi:hypothetical protein